MVILVTLLIVLCVILAWIADDKYWDFVLGISVTGITLLGILDIIMIIMIFIGGYNMVTIDDKIEMYQEENKNIETQITEIVNNYQGYEKEIISNIADMEVAIIKIPELKTSELVKTQMQVYVDNNDKIKELKEAKIEIKVAKWLLYFGK